MDIPDVFLAVSTPTFPLDLKCSDLCIVIEGHQLHTMGENSIICLRLLPRRLGVCFLCAIDVHDTDILSLSYFRHWLNWVILYSVLFEFDLLP